jgi:predicted acylesterase/phospholipase RssA
VFDYSQNHNVACSFVCAASAASTHIELLRSYRSRRIGHQNYDCSIWEAVRATSAAPLFFEPLTLQRSQATFVDGGVRANNPIDQITSEARHLWPGRSIGCLLSLGTGVKIPQGFDAKKSRLHEVLQALAGIATDANNKARDFRDTTEGRELIRGKRYFRYSIPQGVGDVDLADFEKIPYMESMTLPYVIDVDDNIEDCAKTLADPNFSS